MGEYFSHINENLPSMVDVSEKAITTRKASAVSVLTVPSFLLDHFDGAELISKKGPVFATAIIAGSMAAKNTAQLIPFCHSLALEDIKITITVSKPRQIEVCCTVKTSAKTGVEMEALTGASVASLTIYDMCKSVSKDIFIETKLLSKTGGKSDGA